MKTKPKPRVMWANYYPDTKNLNFHDDNRQAKRWSKDGFKPFRVAVIPLCDIEAIVERSCNAHWREAGGAALGRFDYREGIRAALTAAGIPCTKRKALK